MFGKTKVRCVFKMPNGALIRKSLAINEKHQVLFMYKNLGGFYEIPQHFESPLMFKWDYRYPYNNGILNGMLR